jgi:hypothetical protein
MYGMNIKVICDVSEQNFLTVCMLSPNKLILGFVSECMFLYLRLIFFRSLRPRLYRLLNKVTNLLGSLKGGAERIF